MASKIYHINNPAELLTLSTHLQKPESSDTSQQLYIRLLQPLAKPEVLLAVRNPGPHYSYDDMGSRCGRTNYEHLSLNALSKAWRSEWKTLPMSSVESVTFDITLPDIGGRRGTGFWGEFEKDEDGIELAFDQMAPIRLAIVLATVMRMQSRREQGVRFELVCDGPGPRTMEQAREICRKLSKETASG